MSILEIKNLSKKFGKFPALKNVDLTVGKGEVYGFIGPNGAGKTTTIRIILGIYQATMGEVTVFGKDAWKKSVEIHKNISYVPGDVNLWPNLTGGEVIDLFMNLRGNGNLMRRDELIEKFQLDPSKKCRTYSKGNRQKVALISALATDSQFYIFDEPTSGLDPLMESVFHEYVLDLKAQGKSVLLSSHILSEVEKLCDKIAIIKNGEIIENGTLDELRHLTRVNIKVQTEKQINQQFLIGTYNLEQDGNFTSFQVDSDKLGTVISYLATLNIIDLQSLPPSLEELFMTHYKEGDA